MTTTQHNNVATKYAQKFVCCMLAVVMAFALNPAVAMADVRNSDKIVGSSVGDRNLATSLCPDIAADYAYLRDTEGNVYFERSATKPVQIASVTKIMTAIVALEYDPEQRQLITVTAKAAEIGESSAGLRKGDVMDMNTALKALMISSGNDAAVAIATTLGADMLKKEGKSSTSDKTCIKRFVKEMNKKAEALGMERTVFENPHGLDYDEYAGKLHSTAKDVSLMVEYALNLKPLAKIVKTHKTTITVNRKGKPKHIKLKSTDKLLKSYKGTLGVKTGFTSLAGSCFAGACKVDGKILIAIVLHSTDDNQRFADCASLWNWQQAHTVDYRLVNSDTYVSAVINDVDADYPIVARVAHCDWIDKTVRGTVIDYKRTIELFDLEGNVSQSVEFKELHGNVRAGDKLGTITYKQHNEEIATVDIVAAENVDAPGIFEGIGIWWSRLTGGCSGQAEHAESVLINKTPLLIDKNAGA